MLDDVATPWHDRRTTTTWRERCGWPQRHQRIAVSRGPAHSRLDHLVAGEVVERSGRIEPHASREVLPASSCVMPTGRRSRRLSLRLAISSFDQTDETRPLCNAVVMQSADGKPRQLTVGFDPM